MVAKQTTKRKTLSNNKSQPRDNVLSHASFICSVFLFSVTLSMLFFMRYGYLFHGSNSHDKTDEIANCPTITSRMVIGDCDFAGTVTSRFNLQNTVNNWINSIGGSKGVIIYDLKTNEIVGGSNPDQKFATASLYKLFVVYAGYLKVQSGEWGRDDIVGGTGRTILDSLDLAIRESNSECAESLWNMIGRDALDETVHDHFGLANVEVGSFMATPREIMTIMKLFYGHAGITDEDLVGKIKDSFLNQPPTIYNWRQGFPSGFSDSVDVYNKVGWDFNGRSWNIYNDASILDFKSINRHFIVVVMTNGVDFKEITRLGNEIETEINT